MKKMKMLVLTVLSMATVNSYAIEGCREAEVSGADIGPYKVGVAAAGTASVLGSGIYSASKYDEFTFLRVTNPAHDNYYGRHYFPHRLLDPRFNHATLRDVQNGDKITVKYLLSNDEFETWKAETLNGRRPGSPPVQREVVFDSDTGNRQKVAAFIQDAFDRQRPITTITRVPARVHKAMLKASTNARRGLAGAALAGVLLVAEFMSGEVSETLSNGVSAIKVNFQEKSPSGKEDECNSENVKNGRRLGFRSNLTPGGGDTTRHRTANRE